MLKAWISSHIGALITSPRWRDRRRSWRSLIRRLSGVPATVHYFHQADDPYSQLTALLLPAFAARYRIRLVAHLVPPPTPAAAPDAPRLAAWSARDAAQLATTHGLDAPDFSTAPAPDALRNCQEALATALRQDEFVRYAAALGDAMWRGQPLPAVAPVPGQDEDDAADCTTQHWLDGGARLRQKLGHYLGATFYFEGEWYWGPDRLHYLERRLQIERLDWQGILPPLIAPPALHLPASVPAATAVHRPVLHFYCSLRSPYTYLAVARVRQLAQHYGAELRLRPVLPMVMRGLPVPAAKRFYILHDVKREAERLGLRFGRAVDPVGEPVERGLAVLHHAIRMGRGPAFLESFLQGGFADGLNAGGAWGLRKIARRAGLTARQVAAALADDSWRASAEANRNDMQARGLWGVPGFRIDEQPVQWGQDRLWLLEQGLAAARQSAASAEPALNPQP